MPKVHEPAQLLSLVAERIDASVDSPRHEAETVGGYKVDFTRLIYMLFTDMENQIGRMDFKASLVITANSILMLVTANALAFLFQPHGISGTPMLVGLAGLVPSLLLSCFALQSALSVVMPRMPAPGGIPCKDHISYFFSGHIARLNIDDYTTGFLDLDLGEVKKQVIASVHAKATVLQSKIACVRRGIHLTLASFALWVPFISVVAWSNQPDGSAAVHAAPNSSTTVPGVD